MDVLADHRGDRARAGQPPGERRLERVRRVPVLGAPVEVDDHDARAGAARPPGVAEDPPGACEVDRPRMRQRDPVRHLRVREEGDFDAMHTQQDQAPLLPPRRERAGVADAGASQRPPRRADAGLPAVERVVRGGAAGVKAGRLDRARERRRGLEPRVADGRRRRQRRLDVAERERVAPDPAADRPQQRPEVVAAPMRQRTRAGDDLQVRQQVAAHADGQPDGGRRWRRFGRLWRGRRCSHRGDNDRERAHPGPTARRTRRDADPRTSERAASACRGARPPRSSRGR